MLVLAPRFEREDGKRGKRLPGDIGMNGIKEICEKERERKRERCPFDIYETYPVWSCAAEGKLVLGKRKERKGRRSKKEER